MIDPKAITRFDRTPAELEEFLLFCLFVQGKRAEHAAAALQRLLAHCTGSTPMGWLWPRRNDLERLFAAARTGCHTQHARTVRWLLWAALDLRTCHPGQLEAAPYLGPKTSRMLILHSRPGQRYAVLDRVVLAHLRGLGPPAPAANPTNREVYRRWERVVLGLADQSGVTPAGFDLALWTGGRRVTRPVPPAHNPLRSGIRAAGCTSTAF
jgi:hypothetical protein